MFSSIKRAFSAYTAKPLLFIWGSFLYLFLLLVLTLAVCGLFLIYFMIASAFSYELTFEATLESLPNIVVVVILAAILLYFMGAFNAALARTYNDAVSGVKTSFLDFYHYGLSRASVMFGILLMRILISLLVIGPVVLIYYYFLTDYEYMDYILYLYTLAMIFVVDMVFTPVFIPASLGSTPFESFRTAFLTWKNKHVYFIGLYILFAIVWFLNFIPFIQLATIFVLYPIIYSAMILLVEKGNIAPKEVQG